MRLCVVSFKQCWQDREGRWFSYGGFPSQMAAFRSLFDEMTLVVVRAPARAGGMQLPADARIVPLRSPVGVNTRRKLSLAAGLPYYLRNIAEGLRDADIVHTPLPGDIPYLGLLLALAARKRVFALYNGSWVRNSETTWMNRVTRTTMRVLARGNGLMLAVGDQPRPPARNMQWLFATSLHEAELAQHRPDLDRAVGAPPRLVYLGRLSIEKGVPILIRALARLRDERFTPLPVVNLVGDGPERPALEAMVAAERCAGLVEFSGQLERDGLAAACTQADLCVHPSHTEGYCKAWLDAMAFGLPVLTTDVGAARAIVGGNGVRGWVVPAGDAGALAAMLRDVLATPHDWVGLRHRCRAYAEQRTLEAWGEAIARACAKQWHLRRADGRLRG